MVSEKQVSEISDTIQIPAEYRNRFVEEAALTVKFMAEPDSSLGPEECEHARELHAFAMECTGDMLIGAADADRALREIVDGCLEMAGNDVRGLTEGETSLVSRQQVRNALAEVQFWLSAADWIEAAEGRRS